MTIWGKNIGSSTGFAFGGPIGALLGGVAGHAIDKFKTKQKLFLSPSNASNALLRGGR